MKSKVSPALMINEEDIDQLLLEWANIPKWVKAHISTKCPAHRYEGDLAIENGCLTFHGRDIKEGRHFEEVVPLDNIVDVSLNFGGHLTGSIDPPFGIGGSLPFAVHYKRNDENKTAYFNTCADKYQPHNHINNMKWHKALSEIVTRHRVKRQSGYGNQAVVTR